jgi:glucose/arabinose dehydrogenase
VNVVLPGRNYGWPVVSFGREYSGARIAERTWIEGMEQPTIVWLPSIAPSGMIFYTGDRFPGWRGSLFVGSLMVGRIERTGRIERVVLNEAGEEIRREAILTELRQRIRDIRQGPDGLIYVLTDEDDGALLRIEPME